MNKKKNFEDSKLFNFITKIWVCCLLISAPIVIFFGSNVVKKFIPLFIIDGTFFLYLVISIIKISFGKGKEKVEKDKEQALKKIAINDEKVKNINKLISDIVNITHENLEKYLPDIPKEEYEEDGKVYYMNDQNGTTFDWTVNKHLSPFMVFYKDGSCGSAKVIIYSNGECDLSIYKYGEKMPFANNKTKFDKESVFELAVALNKIADNNGLFGRCISDMDTDILLDSEDEKEFINKSKSINQEFDIKKSGSKNQLDKYKTIIIKLDSKKLENPDLDIRYKLPERIEDITKNKVLDNGYDYLTDTELLIFLKPKELGEIYPIYRLFKDEKICNNDLSKCSEMFVSNEENADIDKCIKVDYNCLLACFDSNAIKDIVNVTDEEINNIEKDLNIKVPPKLREFYKKNNGKEIEPFAFNDDIKLVELFPLKYGRSAEYHKILWLDWLKEELIPLGRDEVDIEIYWSTIDYKVYRIDSELEDNLENPVLVYDNVEDLISKLKIKKERKFEKYSKLCNKDTIKVNIFGKEKELTVFCTGDNQFDESGNSKNYNFELSKKELDVLNWFVKNIKIENYKQQIVDYCNDIYSRWQYSDGTHQELIELDDVEKEINITAIAINVTKNWKSNDGFIYPEVSFYGECKCDEEHGICIGFRDEKYLGINSQDWTL